MLNLAAAVRQCRRRKILPALVLALKPSAECALQVMGVLRRCVLWESKRDLARACLGSLGVAWKAVGAERKLGAPGGNGDQSLGPEECNGRSCLCARGVYFRDAREHGVVS